ncbi:hypothetical protein ACKTEK_02300 [Tepidamorphus sp. 3E244]|uniref:hypothetical protein n=1 Tax=Tepidamorphus sp. 3E244 TaxID=3385498 RepID=UPI0038FCCBAC
MPAEPFEGVEGVHPETGLATDYLNHYNEIVMLLELVSDMPECIEDASDWQPKSYVDHFRGSGLAIADGVIAAYEASPARYRDAFLASTRELDLIIAPAIGEIARLYENGSEEAAVSLTETTLDAARGILGQLNGIIHGHLTIADIAISDDTEGAQALVDAMF